MLIQQKVEQNTDTTRLDSRLCTTNCIHFIYDNCVCIYPLPEIT
jgi:hypothetical protein